MFEMMFAASDMTLAAAPVWLGNLWNIGQMIIGFSIIVFVHELGHFAAAKWAGVKVEQFAIGFGKELFGFTKGETRYSFKLLPLGGYVKMLGQEDFVVDKSGELKVKPDPRSFTNKSVSKRMVIVCAGVIMNLIFAAIAFTIVAMVGRMQPPSVVGLVKQDMPAGLAGIQPGDRIVEINGEQVSTFDELMERVSLSAGGETIEIVVERDGKIIDPPFRIVPEYQEEVHRRQIGVSPGSNTRVDVVIQPEGLNSDAATLQRNDKITHVVVDGEKRAVNASYGELERAIRAQMGRPVKLVVQRPKDAETLTTEARHAYNHDVESSEVEVSMKPLMYPVPYNGIQPVSQGRKVQEASVLGFGPRLTIVYTTDKLDGPFDDAGVKMLDVLTRIDTIDHPTYQDAVECFERNTGKTIDLHVRRPYTANKGLSQEAVRFLAEQREKILQTVIVDGASISKFMHAELNESGLPKPEIKSILEKLAAIDDVDAFRGWLENVDVHQLKLKVPTGSLIKDRTLDDYLQVLPVSEGDVLVANIVKEFGSNKTMATVSEIPLYARITRVNDQWLNGWNDFVLALRDHAGKQVQLTYRVLNDIRTVELEVPNCVQAELGLYPGDRIVSIAGQSSIEVPIKQGDNETKVTYYLPDRRAIAALLETNIGKTVKVEYVRFGGEKGSGEYAVTATNTDPWLERIGFSANFYCYALAERNPIANPFTAFVAGTKRAYNATVSTVRTIQRLITRDIGTRNMSGPLGIIAIGSKVADKSALDLLWLLGFLSANLAVINFLPLPIVDGGLFLFLVLEKIRGEPVSIRVQMATQMIGIALIMTIFILVTAQDIYKLFL